MGINIGNYQANSFIVSHGDGYEEYRGLGGDDVYNVNTHLLEDVTITDNQGSNDIVLGNAEIESTDFVSTGVIFHYADGGSLTVIGDMSQYNFIFGGGTDPFDPASGGTDLSFDETAQAFGLDPDSLNASEILQGTVSGRIQSDGTIDPDDTGDAQTVTLDGQGTLEEPVTLDASGGEYLFLDNSTLTENVIIQNFSSDDHIQINTTEDAEYQIVNDGTDVRITFNPMTGADVIQILLEDVVSSEDVIYGEATLEEVLGFDVITFSIQETQYTEIALEADHTYTAVQGESEVFIYEFTDNNDGYMEGQDGTVTIESFDSEEDIIRFVDNDGNPPSQDEFETNGYSVTPNAFSGDTIISLMPDSSQGAPVASDIVLQGVVLSEDQIEIEIV